MNRNLGNMYDDNGAQEMGWLRKQTPGGLFLKVVGVFILLSLFFGIIGFFGGWFNTAAKVVSPANVEKQWDFAYSYNNQLGAIAGNWCSAKQAEAAATGDAKDQRVTQRLAQENLYRTREAEYNAALQNAFKAKLVKPTDVPPVAPTLDQEIASLGLTCGG